MALILNIDTATENASVSISKDGKVISFLTNENQKDHASFLQPAIISLLGEANLTINQLSAVAVTSGPGSYTGVRVGMASAKGLCYALNIPLITLTTLEVMALSSIKTIEDKSALYCPMIDARRMEVFTAVYDYNLSEIIKPCSMVLDNLSFTNLLTAHRVYFSGSGISKLKDLIICDNIYYIGEQDLSNSLALLSFESYCDNRFSNLSYTQPLYLKEFYTL